MMRSIALMGVLALLQLSDVRAENAAGFFWDPAVYQVLFEPDDAKITATARQVIDVAMRDYETVKPTLVHVSGHYDRSETEEYAEQLSRKMAETVRDYLIAAGVPASSIKVDWHGEREPAVPTDDGLAEQYNRRVDIWFE